MRGIPGNSGRLVVTCTGTGGFTANGAALGPRLMGKTRAGGFSSRRAALLGGALPRLRFRLPRKRGAGGGVMPFTLQGLRDGGGAAWVDLVLVPALPLLIRPLGASSRSFAGLAFFRRR
jgi:hypothetical protein